MKQVALTDYELRQAANVGVERQIEALRHGRQHRHGFDGDGWQIHIEGALAELAVAKAFERFWEPVVRHPEELPGDVGDLQVRSTKRSSGSLIVHPDDPDESPFILVIGDCPKFNIVGWLRGREAKMEKWWRTDVREPAFFVPQSALRPVK